MRLLIIILIFLIDLHQCFAVKKHKQPVLKFYSSQIMVGQPFKVSLYYEHEKNEEVIFPDTTWNFSPFELVKKETYTTKTNKDISKDCVVYTLNTFEIEINQSLQMPVYIFSHHDTLKILSNKEQIILKRLVADHHPDLTLKSNTQFIELEQSFDYIFWLLLVLGILFIAGITYLFFGKSIRKQIVLYLAKLAFDRFIYDFDKITIQLNRNKNNNDLDKLLGIWKKYLQNLTQKPTTTYTSKEISEFVGNEKLTIALINIDRAIYGGAFEENVLQDITILKIIAKEYYIQKQEEVKND